jgi:hypothetical protein
MGVGVEGGVVQSNGPRPHLRQHRGGTPSLVSSETSGRSQQRGNAASGGEGRTPHRGGSNGVSGSDGVSIGGRCPAPPVNYWTG